MHLHRTEADALVSLLALEDADRLLTSTALRTPAIRVAQDGAVVPQSRYTRSGATIAGQALTGLLDARKVLEMFNGGATIVFQGLHRYWQPLTELIAELEVELGHPCQANAYLTPPGNQGFAVHSDAHDVFVFQTAGTKLWEIHHEDRVDEVLLEPGRVMYLPTGTPHAARAQDSVSLHVTIGINQLTWRGLVRRSVEQVLTQVPDEHLPAGYLEDSAMLREGLADRLEQVAEQIRGIDPSVSAEREVVRFLSTRPARLAGGLLDAVASGEVDDDTVLRRRPGHPCVLIDGQDGKSLRVLLGDRILTVPTRLRAALEEIRARPDFSPSDLADHLDRQSRLVLCRRLIREGLLTQ